jgi:hypothetical protein
MAQITDDEITTERLVKIAAKIGKILEPYDGNIASFVLATILHQLLKQLDFEYRLRSIHMMSDPGDFTHEHE